MVRVALDGLVPDATVPEFEALVQLRQQLKQTLPDADRRSELLRSLLRQLQQDVLPTGVHP